MSDDDYSKHWCNSCHNWMKYSDRVGAWLHTDTGFATCWKSEADRG